MNDLIRDMETRIIFRTAILFNALTALITWALIALMLRNPIKNFLGID